MRQSTSAFMAVSSICPLLCAAFLRPWQCLDGWRYVRRFLIPFGLEPFHPSINAAALCPIIYDIACVGAHGILGATDASATLKPCSNVSTQVRGERICWRWEQKVATRLHSSTVHRTPRHPSPSHLLRVRVRVCVCVACACACACACSLALSPFSTLKGTQPTLTPLTRSSAST